MLELRQFFLRSQGAVRVDIATKTKEGFATWAPGDPSPSPSTCPLNIQMTQKALFAIAGSAFCFHSPKIEPEWYKNIY